MHVADYAGRFLSDGSPGYHKDSIVVFHKTDVPQLEIAAVSVERVVLQVFSLPMAPTPQARYLTGRIVNKIVSIEQKHCKTNKHHRKAIDISKAGRAAVICALYCNDPDLLRDVLPFSGLRSDMLSGTVAKALVGLRIDFAHIRPG